jgi:hypothetical protein
MDSPVGSEAHRKFYAKFARAASVHVKKPHELDLPEGYVVDPAFSNRNRVLLRNDSTKHAVYSFRSTNVKSPADLATDAALAAGFGAFTSRFQNAVRSTKQAKKALPDYNFTVTGHSLGSSTAAYTHGKIKGLNYVGYSPHVPFNEVQREIVSGLLERSGIRKSNAVTYSVVGDPVALNSQLTFKKNNFTVPQTSKGAHDLGNFVD